MDAIKFMMERQRMCNFYDLCEGCPMAGKPCEFCQGSDAMHLVEVVESWTAAHPRKTRQSVFLELFPSVKLDRNGIIDMPPCRLDRTRYPFNGDKCASVMTCSACRREFWMEEVEK